MNFVEGYSHRHGRVEWEKRELDEWITDVFNAPAITVEAHATNAIRDHIRRELTNEGWSDEVTIAPNFTNVTVFSQRDDLAIQLQTGNVSRVFYDLIKLQYLFSRNKIEAAALAVPTKSGAQFGARAERDPQVLADEFTYADRERTGDFIGPRIFSTGIPFYPLDQSFSTVEEAVKL